MRRIAERCYDAVEVYEQIQDEIWQVDEAELRNLFGKLKVLCEDILKDLIKLDGVKDVWIKEMKSTIAMAIRYIETVR
jgi:hypothetical protein